MCRPGVSGRGELVERRGEVVERVDEEGDEADVFYNEFPIRRSGSRCEGYVWAVIGERLDV